MAVLRAHRLRHFDVVPDNFSRVRVRSSGPVVRVLGLDLGDSAVVQRFARSGVLQCLLHHERDARRVVVANEATPANETQQEQSAAVLRSA